MQSTRVVQSWIKTWVLVALLITAIDSQADVAIPPLKAHVTDLTATLSPQEITQLEQRLVAFEKKKGSQITVLIVPTTRPETIEQYSIRVVEVWKLGRKDIDDGVLLLVAKNDRALRIEVGYGLEGVLPDAKAKRIIEELIVPQFKAGNFVSGMNAGVDAVLSLLEGESLPSPQTNKRDATHSTNISVFFDNILFIFVGFIVVGRLLQSLLGRLAGATVTSIGVGFVSWMLFSSVVTAVAIACVAFFASLFQHTSRGIYRNGRGHWEDNHFRNNSIGRGSFGGGFGGGGGGFGGGGASGRW